MTDIAPLIKRSLVDQALEQLRWQAWVAQNPEHLAAWQYVQRVSQRFAPLLEQPHGASRALRSSRRQTLKTLLVLGVAVLLIAGILVSALGSAISLRRFLQV